MRRLDAARVYRLALERGAEGPFHAVAEEGASFEKIAEMIRRRLNIPTVSKSPEEAPEHFDWLARFASSDVPTSSRGRLEIYTHGFASYAVLARAFST